MTSQQEAFVYDAIRTPRGRGKRTGALHSVKPVSLVVGLIDGLRRRRPDLDPELIDDIVLGVVTPVGDQGADVAKTAALAAGLPQTVSGVQLNRFCASGLEAVNVAAQKVRSGWEDLVLAGGDGGRLGDHRSLVTQRRHDAEHDVVDERRIETGIAAAHLVDQPDDERDGLDAVQRTCLLAPAARRAQGIVNVGFGSHGATSGGRANER